MFQQSDRNVDKLDSATSFRFFLSMVFQGLLSKPLASFSPQGKGDESCHFRVMEHKDLGFVTLESNQMTGNFVGITPDGRIQPTVDTGQDNVRLFPEVIKCERGCLGDQGRSIIVAAFVTN